MKVIAVLPPHHLRPFGLCFQLLFFSTLPFSVTQRIHSVVIFTKVTMPKTGSDCVSTLSLRF